MYCQQSKQRGEANRCGGWSFTMYAPEKHTLSGRVSRVGPQVHRHTMTKPTITCLPSPDFTCSNAVSVTTIAARLADRPTPPLHARPASPLPQDDRRPCSLRSRAAQDHFLGHPAHGRPPSGQLSRRPATMGEAAGQCCSRRQSVLFCRRPARHNNASRPSPAAAKHHRHVCLAPSHRP